MIVVGNDDGKEDALWASTWEFKSRWDGERNFYPAGNGGCRIHGDGLKKIIESFDRSIDISRERKEGERFEVKN